jgi:hypothetical protein
LTDIYIYIFTQREHEHSIILNGINVSVRELLFEGDNTVILIVLKNVSQTIPGFHSSGVWVQDDGHEQVGGNCGIYSLKDSRVKSGPLLILDTRGICRWCLSRRGNN